MPAFETRRRVPFTATEMFELVADVESYPRFLPLCEGLRILSRDGDGPRRSLVAVMDVGYKAIRESFTSRVALDAERPHVRADLVEGPFHRLVNEWSFTPLAGGSEVVFRIDYEFKSTMLQLLMGSLFDRAFSHFAEAFEDRAHAVYGRRPAIR